MDAALRSCLHIFEALRNATETRVMERVRTHARRGDPTLARKHVYTHVYKCVYAGVYKRAPKKQLNARRASDHVVHDEASAHAMSW